MTDIEIRRQKNRKTLMMRLKPDGGVLVMIPRRLKPDHPDVQRFIAQGLDQLAEHLPATRPQAYNSSRSIRALVRKWARRMNVEVGRVSLRQMFRKWGSCSAQGNITLNTALFYVPPHLAEYIVVHELAHLRVFDHSPAFWAVVAEYLPHYRALEEELNTYPV